jgi:hypothetical protein
MIPLRQRFGPQRCRVSAGGVGVVTDGRGKRRACCRKVTQCRRKTTRRGTPSSNRDGLSPGRHPAAGSVLPVSDLCIRNTQRNRQRDRPRNSRPVWLSTRHCQFGYRRPRTKRLVPDASICSVHSGLEFIENSVKFPGNSPPTMHKKQCENKNKCELINN